MVSSMAQDFRGHFYLLGGLFSFLPLLPLSAQSWIQNTFPGLGHAENAGSWSIGQGMDRSEWISSFGVSRQIPPGDLSPLMLQATDLGGILYCADGEHFRPANLPHNNGIAVGFHPHDGRIGYALIHRWLFSHESFLWKTTDKGRTWTYLTTGSYYRGAKNLIAADPHRLRTGHLCLATKAGLKRSLDHGDSWSILPGTAAMAFITVAFNRDGSALYAVTDQGMLLRLDLADDESGNFTLHIARSGGIRDIEPHPADPATGWCVDTAGRICPFTEYGASLGTAFPVLFNNKESVFANPANPLHLLCTGNGRFFGAYEWSSDGGQTWSQPNSVVIGGQVYFPGFIDYSPFNHDSAHYYVPDRADTAIQGERRLLGFWPGHPSRVVQWFTNKHKQVSLSEDYGAIYRPFAHGGSVKEPTQMALGSTDDVITIARVEQGVIDTENGGRWWRGRSPHNESTLGRLQQARGNRWYDSTMHGVAIDPHDDRHRIATYSHHPAVILRSVDGGASWTEVAEFPLDFNTSAEDFTRRWVFWHPQKPEIIYAGKRISLDRGLTWQEIPGQHAVTAMCSSNGDLLVHRSLNAILHFSRDAGTTWHRIPPALSPSGIRYVIPDGRHPGAVSIDPRPAFDATIEGRYLRLLVGGRNGVYEFCASNQNATTGTWTRITTGIDLTDPYVPTGGSIYLSHTVFDPRPGYQNVVYLAAGIGYLAYGDIHANYYRQLYRSRDAGLSWERIVGPGFSGSPPDWFTALAPMVVSPHTGKLYIQSWWGQFRFGGDDHSAVLPGAFSEGNGHFVSDWFGRFSEDGDKLAHEYLGEVGLYAEGGGWWLYLPGAASWFWTSPAHYPWVAKAHESSMADWYLLPHQGFEGRWYRPATKHWGSFPVAPMPAELPSRTSISPSAEGPGIEWSVDPQQPDRVLIIVTHNGATTVEQSRDLFAWTEVPEALDRIDRLRFSWWQSLPAGPPLFLRLREVGP